MLDIARINTGADPNTKTQVNQFTRSCFCKDKYYNQRKQAANKVIKEKPLRVADLR